MLEGFFGLPAHPLLVHAPVVLIPLLALLTIGYAIAAPIRPHTRWVLGLLALAAPVAALGAKLSGDALFNRWDRAGRITEGFYPTLENHQRLGNLTLLSTIALSLVALALVYFLRPRGERAPRWPDHTLLINIVLAALAVLAGLASLVLVVLTGHSGSEAVWSDW